MRGSFRFGTLESGVDIMETEVYIRSMENAPRTVSATEQLASPVIAALEACWAEIQQHHAEVPDVVLIIGTGKVGRRALLGYFWAERWALAEAEGRLPEVLIAGECMAKGAADVMATLIHEAAHALATARDIKDTSRQGRWHNRKFKALAEEMGLTVNDEPDSKHGYAFTKAPAELLEQYATVAPLAEALRIHMSANLIAAAPTEAKPRPVYACDCREASFSKKVLEDGPIICGLCREEFLEVVG